MGSDCLKQVKEKKKKDQFKVGKKKK